MRRPSRTLYSTAIAITWILATLVTEASAQIRVRVPFVDVDNDSGSVRVRAPFVSVDTDAAGTRVRAPFTHVQTDRGIRPPAGLPMICVEFADDTGLSREGLKSPPTPQTAPQPRPESAEPPPAPKPAPESAEPAPANQRPESRKPAPAPRPRADSSPDDQPTSTPRNGRTNESNASGEVHDAPDASDDHFSSYLVVPVRPGEPRPRLRVYVEPPPVSPKAEQDLVPGDRLDESAPPPSGDKKVPADPPPVEPSVRVIRLQPTWHTHVPQYFQPTAGVHVFAFVHPYTHQSIPVQVDLPPGNPRLRISNDELEFDYGRVEVEIRFRKDGRVAVRTNR